MLQTRLPWKEVRTSLGRYFSQSTSVVSRDKNLSLANIPQGTGGRASQSGKTIAILGSTGFVGRYLVNELGRSGNTLVVGTRGDDMSWRHLKPLADLGKLVPSYYDLKDEDSIRKVIEGADVVINLQGKHYETKHFFPWIINYSFEDVHIKGAEKVARIAREENVKHFVHLSSVATEGEESGMSRWSLSKKRGEEVIKKEFPGAVIVRSNVIYGEEDRLLNWYASQIQLFPFVPLVNEGKAQVQPVYVLDVAKALATIAQRYMFCNEVFSLDGPHVYSYKQVAEYVAEEIRTKVNFIELPTVLAKTSGKMMQTLPNPMYSEDTFQLLLQDQLQPKASNILGFKDVGITPQEMERKGFNFLFKYRTGGHFIDPRAEQVTHS